MSKKKFHSLFLTLFISFSLIIRPTYASPPWLTVGFYAKYNLRLVTFQPIISLEDPHHPESSYYGLGNGSFIWKVEKLEKNIALIKVNFSIVGIVFDSMEEEIPLWSKVELSRSFHILVDINNRLILNTSNVSPLYFPYWIPIGTREGEELFMGHQKLENTWLLGKFYLCGMDIDTGLKKFRGSDILFFTTYNMTEVHRGYLPFFDGFYDRESGLLIALTGTEQLSLKFLTIWIGVGVVGMVLDSFGVEPVSTTDDNSFTNQLPVPNISILGIVVPPEVEVEKEFELSLMLFNNGTINTGNFRVLLSSLDGNFKTLSDSEVSVENISPGETKEVKWRLTLRSEGECHLRLSILKNTTLLQRDLVIRGRNPRFGGVELFIIIILILSILFVLILLTLLGRRRKCLSPYYLGKSRV